MARLARIVVPGLPYHVTRPAARAACCATDDYALYRDLLGGECRAADGEAWASCLRRQAGPEAEWAGDVAN
jgi:putative transposase